MNDISDDIIELSDTVPFLHNYAKKRTFILERTAFTKSSTFREIP